MLPLPAGREASPGHGVHRYDRDGTTHVLFEPLDFIARLAALISKPRVNLTRYHGVFAPNSHLRAQVIPAQRGRRTGETAEEADRTASAGHAAMTWAQRLKRVFRIDIETCSHCGGAVKIIARIEDPMVMPKALRGAGSRKDTHPPEQTNCLRETRSVAREPGTPSNRSV